MSLIDDGQDRSHHQDMLPASDPLFHEFGEMKDQDLASFLYGVQQELHTIQGGTSSKQFQDYEVRSVIIDALPGASVKDIYEASDEIKKAHLVLIPGETEQERLQNSKSDVDVTLVNLAGVFMRVKKGVPLSDVPSALQRDFGEHRYAKYVRVPERRSVKAFEAANQPVVAAEAIEPAVVSQSADVFVEEKTHPSLRTYGRIADGDLRKFLEEQVEPVVQDVLNIFPLSGTDAQQQIARLNGLNAIQGERAVQYLREHSPLNYLTSYNGVRNRKNAVMSAENFRFANALVHLASEKIREEGDKRFLWEEADASLQRKLGKDLLSKRMDALRDLATNAYRKHPSKTATVDTTSITPREIQLGEGSTLRIKDGHMPGLSERQMEALASWDRKRLASLEALLHNHQDYDVVGPQLTQLPPEALITLQSVYALATKNRQVGLKITNVYAGELRQYLRPSTQLMDLQLERKGQELSLKDLNLLARQVHTERSSKFAWMDDTEGAQDASQLEYE